MLKVESINKKKTDQPKVEETGDILLDNDVVKNLKSFNYLGITLTQNGKSSDDIYKKICLGKRVIRQLELVLAVKDNCLQFTNKNHLSTILFQRAFARKFRKHGILLSDIGRNYVINMDFLSWLKSDTTPTWVGASTQFFAYRKKAGLLIPIRPFFANSSYYALNTLLKS